MDPNRTSFSELLEQFHAGDTDAMAKLYASYNRVIREAVRRRLPQRLRPEFDSLDFAQDVWTALCSLPHRKYHFVDREALEQFLSQIAYNRCINQACSRDTGATVCSPMIHSLDWLTSFLMRKPSRP